ncbi:MAG: hypothetical protein MJH10_12300 [Epibacterium sp.]|nr:hypothetical protein [Epibacterium sp.]NQX74330.1 hypothetical protein [Epibacterium sp.]
MATIDEHNDVIRRTLTIFNSSQLNAIEMLGVLSIIEKTVLDNTTEGAEEVDVRDGEEPPDKQDAV